jgi:hypothetical protein
MDGVGKRGRERWGLKKSSFFIKILLRDALFLLFCLSATEKGLLKRVE